MKYFSNNRMTGHVLQINIKFGAVRVEKGEVDQDNKVLRVAPTICFACDSKSFSAPSDTGL